MHNLKKLVIVGGTSSLGSRIAADTFGLPGWKVFTTSSKAGSNHHLHLDLEFDQDFSSLDFVDQDTTVLIFSAVSDPATVFGNTEKAERINVIGTSRLIRFLFQRNCRVIFASSVEVFDGVNPPQDETRTVNPLNAYGSMKAKVEALIQEIGQPNRFSIVRTPWIAHLNIQSRCVIKNTYEAMLGSEVPCFASDYITGVVSADDLSVAYLRLFTSELLPPIVHFASDGFFSRAQLAMTIKGISALHSRMRFSETIFSDLNLTEPRAKDTRLAKGIAESKYRLRFEPIEETIAKKVRLLDGYFQTKLF